MRTFSQRPTQGRSEGRAAAVRHSLGSPRLQKKLEVGAADDEYEREADRVAEQVTRGAAPIDPVPPLPSPLPLAGGEGSASPRVQRACACGGTCSSCREDEEKVRRSPSDSGPVSAEAPGSVHDALSSPGRPLDSGTRAYFEPRFGHDFARVRVHTDSQAAASARDVSAQAYTVGHDLVFAPGRYAPGTPSGDRLLAHELTHVVQQGAAGGSAGLVQRRKETDPTIEESRGVQPPSSGGNSTPMKMLAASNFDKLVVPFQTALKGAGSNADATKAVREHGGKLWEKAVKRAQGTSADQDDRPLYWARLDMARALRQWQPTAFALTAAKREDLLGDFERAARGMLDADFDKKAKGKRVLVSGFDPFGLEDTPKSIERGNPSGAAVLSLDGQTISNGGVDAEVQGVIFPVRYADFDARTVETFFQPYLTGTKAVNMIVTISQGGSASFEVEKYAGRRRSSTYPDNLAVKSGGTAKSPVVPKGLGTGPEFLETSLPAKEMQSGSGKAKVDFDTSQSKLSTGEAVEGSGGGYLSNEIFYRTALLRSDSGSKVPYGHLHTPYLDIPEKHASAAAFATARDAIASQVKEILKAALPAI